MSSPTQQSFPTSQSETAFRGLIGFAEKDMTPPVGIYSRNWGAARHDTSNGVHRPLRMLVMALAESANPSTFFILVTLDTCVFRETEYTMLEAAIREASGLEDPSRIILQSTHTHAGCPLTPEDRDQPGGHLIAAHLDRICNELQAAVREAIAKAEEAFLCWRYGNCGLATNRDVPQPGAPAGHYACGYNPSEEADTTLCVGRVCSVKGGRVLGVLAHYACHPTTLAWENTKLSPDWLGAAREVVSDSHSAPLLILQGTSGDQAPRRQYSGDPALADANGREVGYAILSVLAGMLPAGTSYAYDFTLKSGADLGVWKTAEGEPPVGLEAELHYVDVPLKPYESEESLREKLADCEDHAEAERLRRQIMRVRILGGKDHYSLPLTCWQVGSSLWLVQPQEACVCYQQRLRAAFPGRVILPMNLAGGPNVSYLYPREFSLDHRYPVWVSSFAPDAYPLLEEYSLHLLKSKINQK